jgi:hypothetical protein
MSAPNMSKPKLSGMVCEGWQAEFQIQPNHVTANAAFDGAMFETYGADLDHVLSFANAKSKRMRRMVWTLVEDDDGDAVIVEGYHLINRLGYFITAKPAKAGYQYVVTLS